MYEELTEEMKQIIEEARELKYRYGLTSKMSHGFALYRYTQANVIKMADPMADFGRVKALLLQEELVIKLSFIEMEALRESLGLSNVDIEDITSKQYVLSSMVKAYTEVVINSHNANGPIVKSAEAIQWVAEQMLQMQPSKPITSAGRTIETLKEREESLTPLQKAQRDHVRMLNLITAKENKIKEVKEEIEISQKARGTLELEIHDTRSWKFLKHKELLKERDGVNDRLKDEEDQLVGNLIELSELQSELQIINAKVVSIKLEAIENEMESFQVIIAGAFAKYGEISQKVSNLLQSTYV